jgi:23S rRNA pseudouridine1911/1915/1917 synthase
MPLTTRAAVPHGWPIVGDPTYGPRPVPRFADRALDETVAALRRQALHAWRVSLLLPSTTRRLDVTAPLPTDLAELIAAAGLDAPGAVGAARARAIRPGTE